MAKFLQAIVDPRRTASEQFFTLTSWTTSQSALAEAYLVPLRSRPTNESLGKLSSLAHHERKLEY